MATVRVLKIDEPRKDGKYPIRIRVGKDRKYAHETIFYVKEGHWNDSAKQVQSYDVQSQELNAVLRERHKQVLELIDFYEQQDWPYTAQDILRIDYLEWKANESKARQLAGLVLPTGILHFGRTVVIPFWKKKTNLTNADKYALEMDLFEDFLKTLQPPQSDVSMLTIDTSLIEDYFSYLRNKPTPCRKDSTLRRRLAQLLAILHMAFRQGVISTLPRLEVELNIIKSKKTKLTKAQIEQLEEYVLASPLLAEESISQSTDTMIVAVQTFLMQYYLYGARVGDMLLLRNENVISTNGEPTCIEYYQQKGRKKGGKRQMSIYLNSRLLPIISAYWNPTRPNDFLLPWLATRWKANPGLSEAQNGHALKQALNQATAAMNNALKRVRILLKMDAHFSSHSARHSYAQRAKQKGKPVEWIKDSLGHSSSDITAVYLEDLDSDELNRNMQDVYE